MSETAAAPASPPPPAYRQTASSGPPGQVRSIGVCILLAIVTLGIYTYVWTWRTHEEIKRHSGQGVGGAVGFLIYFVISPVTWFLLPSEVNTMLKQAGRESRVSGLTGFWMLLPLAGPFIWFFRVQG